ncbi:hypothetical protein SO802_006335 [Lithocarpus litseifolius]|uniref:Uncharacterized protein n=1 Tax=Lithocarpus litseifolius TaxID=425828 RepID=A0AAW2DKK8_9ROSI
MERESKYVFAAFSWADEVEKEEEAQAQPHQIQKQKTNPFGSARPREVVLQERGIDWGKLDQDLITLSNVRNKAQSEKSCKENIPAPAAHVFDIIQSDPPSRSLEQKPADIRQRISYPDYLTSPAFVAIPVALTIGKNRLGTEKEKARNKQRLQKAQSLDPRSHIHLQLDQNIIWSNRQSSEFKNNGTESQHLVLQMESQRRSKNLRKSAACMNQQEMRMFNAQNLVGTPLVNERRAPLLRRDKWWSLAHEREWKNLQDDHARSDSSFSRGRVNNSRTERSFAEELEWEIRGFDNEGQKLLGMSL